MLGETQLVMRKRSTGKWSQQLTAAGKVASAIFLVLFVFSAVVDEEGEGGEASVKVNVSETVGFVKNVDERVMDIVVSSGNWITSVGKFFLFIIESLWRTVIKIFVFLTQLITQPINLLKRLRVILRRMLWRMWLAIRKLASLFVSVFGRLVRLGVSIVEKFDWVFHYPRVIIASISRFVKNMGTYCKVLWAPVRELASKIGRLFVDFSWATLLDILITPVRVVKWVARVVWRFVPAKELILRLLRVVLRLPIFLLRSIWDSLCALERITEQLFLLHLRGFKYMAEAFVEFMDLGKAFGHILSVVGRLVSRIGGRIMQILERLLAIPLRLLARFKPLFVAIWNTLVKSAKGLKKAWFATWGVVTNLPNYMVKGLNLALKGLLNIELDLEVIKNVVKRFFNVPVRILGWGWDFVRVIGRVAVKPVNWALLLGRKIAVAFKRLVWGITWEDIKRWLLSPFNLVMGVLTELTKIPWFGALFALVEQIVYSTAILIAGIFQAVFTLLKTFYLFFSRADMEQVKELMKR